MDNENLNNIPETELPETEAEETAAAEAVEAAESAAEETVSEPAGSEEETTEETAEDKDGEETDEENGQTDSDSEEDEAEQMCPGCNANPVASGHQYCRKCERKYVKTRIGFFRYVAGAVALFGSFFAFVLVSIAALPSLQVFEGLIYEKGKIAYSAVESYRGTDEVVSSVQEALGANSFTDRFLRTGSGLDGKLFRATVKFYNPLMAEQYKQYIFDSPGAEKYKAHSKAVAENTRIYKKYEDTYLKLQNVYDGILNSEDPGVKDGEKALADIPELKFYGFDRFEASSDYSSYCGDANKIDSISKVFPVFFILIACLVCLTTMTRMVDEHRITIGTYKALGYSPVKIASKYLFYGAFASIAGSCLGTAVGLQVFPRIIYSCYRILYNVPSIDTPFKLWYMAGCCAVSLVCICGAVLYSCIKALRSQPSELMRPKAPQNGRRVLLERAGFIWTRMSFLSKVTVRNLLRYKKRFFMTIVGVAGCTALIITGFGLKHSISTIVDKQFGEVLLYDALVVLNTGSYDRDQLSEKLSSLGSVSDFDLIQSNDAEASLGEQSVGISMVVAQHSDRIHNYLSLSDIGSDERLSISSGSCIVTKKMSMLMNIKKGDTIEITQDDKTVSVPVSGIAENYAIHYVYLSADTYKALFEKEPVYNTAYVNIKDGADESEFKKDIIACSEFYGVSVMSEAGKDFLTSLDSLDAVVILLIVCAGLLAIVVLYNLANINITERVREIATIKVLGFYDIETSAYIYRENIITAVLGMMIGALAGIVLHRFVVITSEVDIVLFNRKLVWWAYLLGAAITVVFTVIVNFALHFKLKKIDMVESMKSVE